jgi:hypothetical protein
MKKLVLVIVVILLASLFLSADDDLYVKRMEKMSAFEMMGKKNPENVEIKEMWLGENRFVQHSKMLSIILDGDKEKIYFILHPEKSYFEFSTDINREKLLEMVPPKIAEVISSIEIKDVKVTIGGAKKQVANWNCKASEFEMTIMVPAMGIMPKYKIRLWTTEDIPFDYKKYSKAADEFFVNHILGIVNIDEDSKREMEKMETIEGFQVAAEVTITIFGSEINIEMQVLEIEERPAPADAYSVPEGYTKKTFDFTLGFPGHII